MQPYFESEAGKIYKGDCLEVLRSLPDESVHCCVTDPPYELGFMGKKWDSSGIAYNVDLWSEVLRVLKPGAHLLAFGGTRTHHRLICAVEDAGFEIRDCIAWAYGSGFPKSLNVGKAVDELQGNKRIDMGNNNNSRVNTPKVDVYNAGIRGKESRVTKGNSEWEGYGTAVKPAVEYICLARKPLDGTVANNVLTHGCGGLDIDGCRVDTDGRPLREVAPLKDNYDYNANSLQGRKDGTLQSSKAIGNTKIGRFPANLIHDGSPEVVGLFPETSSGFMAAGQKYPGGNVYGKQSGKTKQDTIADSGSAARFFKSCPFDEHDLEIQRLIYRAKASPAERGAANNHPTVKPLSLIQYLIQLACPPSGTVLDPFFGSGTTGIAAYEYGRRFIGIELSETYLKDIAVPRIKRETQQMRLFAV